MSGMFDDDLFSGSPEEGYEPEEDVKEEGPEAKEEVEEGHPSEEEAEESEEKMWANKYQSPEELERAYLHLQSKLGERDGEKEELRQRLQLLEQYVMNSPMGYQQQAAPEEKETDFIEEFYDDPEATISRRVDNIVEQRLQEINPTINNLQQFMAEQYYLRKASELTSKYPDFQELIPEIRELGSKHPQLATDPNGMELAYQIAKGQKMQALAEQGRAGAAKKAARMPGSTGGTRRTERQLTDEEAIIDSIFGESNENAGIFD